MSEPAGWRRLEACFAEAVELEPGERRRYLAVLAGRQPALAARLERLLAADGTPGDPLAALIADEAGRLAATTEAAPGATGTEGAGRAARSPPGSSGDAISRVAALAGRRIGSWQLRRQLGEGGMSVVYLATRADRQFDKEVAVKLLKGGVASRELRRRFAVERQILARLEHPNIARLLDAGTTDEGVPYVVMEYVAGEALDRYCDRHRLSLTARLELVERVCDAVAYAHRNLVVHRDLKPGNILVTPEGLPKLLDFGIAKLLQPRMAKLADTDRRQSGTLPAAAEVTTTGWPWRPLTPGYASPEQFEGELITTASDVYSLGVLLCELLCGRRPHRFTGLTPAEMEAAVLAGEPSPPSRLLRPDAAPPAEHGPPARPAERPPEEVASLRRLRSPALARRLRGDLDAIVLTALRREPAQRYATAAELGADLRRHREGLPVKARPDTLAYRTGKFLRRHRLSVSLVASVALLVLAQLAALAVQSSRLGRQRDAAERQRLRAERVSDLMMGLFELSEPGARPADEISARELLAEGAARAYRELDGEPATQAMVLARVGRIYRQLGLYEEAEPLLTDALALRRRVLSEAAPELAASLNELAILNAETGRLERAEELFRQALTVYRRAFGDEHVKVANGLNNLALLAHERGHYREAAERYRQALAMLERLFGPDHPELATTVDNLGLLLCDRGACRQGEELLRRGLALRRGAVGDGHPDVAGSQLNLAAARLDAGALDEAAALLDEALATFGQQLGEAHPNVARVLHRQGELALARGEAAGAAAIHRRALTLRRSIFGDEHPEVAASLGALGEALRHQGEDDAAEQALHRAQDLYEVALTAEHPERALAAVAYGRLLLDRGQCAAALGRLAAAHRILARELLPGDERTAAAADLLADCRRRAASNPTQGESIAQ